MESEALKEYAEMSLEKIGGKKKMTIKCVRCGKEVEAKCTTKKYCDECAAIVTRENNRKSAQLFRARYGNVRKKPRPETEEERSLPKRRCLFCGSTDRVSKEGFCIRCRRDGFDNVYALTGRSNGWEKRKEQKAKRKTYRLRGRGVQGRTKEW